MARIEQSASLLQSGSRFQERRPQSPLAPRWLRPPRSPRTDHRGLRAQALADQATRHDRCDSLPHGDSGLHSRRSWPSARLAATRVQRPDEEAPSYDANGLYRNWDIPAEALITPPANARAKVGRVATERPVWSELSFASGPRDLHRELWKWPLLDCYPIIHGFELSDHPISGMRSSSLSNVIG
jgi:hypothetical protein